MALKCALAVQTSIITEGFRSLAEGEQVEFFVESGDDGRTKAVQVTGPAGAPPQVRTPELVLSLQHEATVRVRAIIGDVCSRSWGG